MTADKGEGAETGQHKAGRADPPEPKIHAAIEEEASKDEEPRLRPGMLLNDRYEVIRLIGRGGMGEVYLAADRKMNRNVALKVLHPGLVSSKESLERFAREAQTVSALNHPNILTIYEVETGSDGTLFFVAEFVEGKTLSRVIRSGCGLDRALDLGIQIASALSAAHEAGVVHRDIKPENIVVRKDGFIKVLDFGLAKLSVPRPGGHAESEDPTAALLKTREGSVMGTAAFMSPEQARGKKVDERTDIWSLGVVLYEMITGRRPFEGDSQADILASVLVTEPQPISALVEEIPTEIDWIVLKALSKDIDARYQTAKELRADLEKVKKQLALSGALISDGRSGRENAQGRDPITYRLGAQSEAATMLSGGPIGTGEDSGMTVKEARPQETAQIAPRKSALVRYAVVGVAAASLLAIAAYFYLRTGSPPIDSVAVLPFVNSNGDPDLLHISDGLSEGLIDQLTRIPELKVLTRNSSFRFRGPELDLGSVASRLGVRALVTGRVERQGQELVVRVDIVDAENDRQLGGETFRRRPEDLVKLQNEISEVVLQQLRLRLTDSQRTRLDDGGTENSEAYSAYLNGLVELNGPQDVRGRALEYFERAVTLDPRFAPAHAEIAWIYWSLANGSSDPRELMPKAKAATDRALEIDPNFGKAHVLRALIMEHDLEWAGAEREYRRAIELSPNLDFAHNNFAFFLSVVGRHDEALDLLDKQIVRDPINKRLTLLHKGIVLTQARRWDDALLAYREAQAADPAREIPHFSLGYAYGGKGSLNEAAGYYKRSVDLLGGEDKYSQPLVYLAATYAKMPEKRADARVILNRIESMPGYVSPALLAIVYTALHDNDRAIALLEEAYIKRDLLLRYIATGYEYDSLRSDPRFADLLKRLGLPK